MQENGHENTETDQTDTSPRLDVELSAGSLAELFAEATRALCDALTQAERVMAREARVVELEAADPERLLLAWLAELLVVFETEKLLFSSARIQLWEDGKAHLKGRLWGEPFDPQRHPLRGTFKALDSRALKIRWDGDLWHTHLVGNSAG